MKEKYTYEFYITNQNQKYIELEVPIFMSKVGDKVSFEYFSARLNMGGNEGIHGIKLKK